MIIRTSDINLHKYGVYHTSNTDLSEVFVNALQKRFNIIALLDINNIDQNWDILKDILVATRKIVYEPKDRYVIVHSDTDYYLPGCPYGLSMLNLVRTFLHNDIPLDTLLLITDHKGIKKELLLTLKQLEKEISWPWLLQSFVDPFLTS